RKVSADGACGRNRQPGGQRPRQLHPGSTQERPDLLAAAGQVGRRVEPVPEPGRARPAQAERGNPRSEEHTSELQSRENLVCRLLLEKKKYVMYSALRHEL